jgi:biotin carboxyl carrier protein
VDLKLRRGEIRYQVHRAGDGEGTTFHIRQGREGEEHAPSVLPAAVEPLGDGEFRIESPAGPRRGYAVRDGDAIWVELGGATFRLEVDRGPGRRRGSGRPDAVSSPMPGQVVRVLVAVGDRVQRGETLLVVEAMKMQIEIAAPHDGTVRRLPFAAGDKVDAGVELAEIEGES